MFTFVRSKQSARLAHQTLFVCQAVDLPARSCERSEYVAMLQEPSLSTTKRLPGLCLIHVGMKIRFTCNALPPFISQDTTGTILEILLKNNEPCLRNSTGVLPGMVKLQSLPEAVLIKVDDCETEFLAPKPCVEHASQASRACGKCSFLPGVVLVKPVNVTWFFQSPTSKSAVKVQRWQLPLVYGRCCPLYSMQGVTATPGLIAHFAMPRSASPAIKFLITYVLLSRVRSLDALRTLGLSNEVLEIIERGAPQELVGTFHKMFDAKIEETQKDAQIARQKLNWFRDHLSQSSG